MITSQQHRERLLGMRPNVYAAGIAGAVNGQRAPSRTYVPDVIYCNVGRRHAGIDGEA